MGLAIIAEPYKQITSQDWKQDTAFLVTIYRNGNVASPPMRPLANGQGFVLVEWGGVNVIGIYTLPSWPRDKFEKMLKEIDRYLDKVRNKHFTIVAGDFNAKSAVWGSKSTDTRGKILNEWMVERDMFLLNDRG